MGFRVEARPGPTSRCLQQPVLPPCLRAQVSVCGRRLRITLLVHFPSKCLPRRYSQRRRAFGRSQSSILPVSLYRQSSGHLFTELSFAQALDVATGARILGWSHDRRYLRKARNMKLDWEVRPMVDPFSRFSIAMCLAFWTSLGGVQKLTKRTSTLPRRLSLKHWTSYKPQRRLL